MLHAFAHHAPEHRMELWKIQTNKHGQDGGVSPEDSEIKKLPFDKMAAAQRDNGSVSSFP